MFSESYGGKIVSDLALRLSNVCFFRFAKPLMSSGHLRGQTGH